MARKPTAHQKNAGKGTRQQQVERFQRRLLLALIVVLAAVGLLAWGGGRASQAGRWLEDWLNRSQAADAVAGRRVGLVVGHQGYDSGAVCENGVSEGAVVQRIAQLTAERLRRLGAQVELLDEYDERLNGFQADVFVSIHADSCIDRSGFKIARSETSVIPEVEDRLVACLTNSYGEATGLAFDANSITPDMTQYHAFKRVTPQTPAAIVEAGFLGGDAAVIQRRPDRSARGIANGIVCFLRSPA